jgi:hypothetical protein
LVLLAPPDLPAFGAGLVLLAALAAVDLALVRGGARRTVVAFFVVGFFGAAVLRFAARVGLRARLTFFGAGRWVARELFPGGFVAGRPRPRAAAAGFLATGLAAARCGLAARFGACLAARCGLAARFGAGLVRARADAELAAERTGAARAAVLVAGLTGRRGAALTALRAPVGFRAPALLAERASLAALAAGRFTTGLAAPRPRGWGAGLAAFVAALATRARAGGFTALAALVGVT